jgi:hypothetical protein
LRFAPDAVSHIQRHRLPKFQIADSMDSAEQLQRIYLAGFELQTFDRYPKCIGVIRDHCVALLVPGVDGLQVLGTPGWRMGEVMGVLTEVEGRQVFQAKSEIVEATPERLEALQSFREELAEFLRRPDHRNDVE